MKKLSDKVTFKHGAVISNRMVQHKDKWGEADAFPMAVANAVFGVVKKYAFDNLIIGYRISPEEINPDNVGYTWHEATKLIDELTNKFDFDYIYLSLPDYKSKPKDSNKTFAELVRPVMGQDTKLIIVGNVMNQADAEDALNYTELVTARRAQIIDASFSAKVVVGEDDKIIKKMSAQEEESQVLTPRVREVMDMNTNRPNWGKKLKEVDYSKAIKVGEYFY
ncbi:hypothetical protein [Lactobacillus taiwanensis]|uniref:hypothetical protein n=1 Tax=Lactobacillus taiwanensis TaxID=508451 RepID=UPI0025A9469C|nr:hypothetical protein [Lactobacillus taiwanensis]